MTKAWQQGHFDGLCGVYSTINAVNYLDHTFGEDDCAAFFEFLIKAGGDLFPVALYEGLNFYPLVGIIEKAIKHLAPRMKIEMKLPFLQHEAATLDAYLGALRPMIDEPHSCCIVGLGEPWGHWTVIKQVLPKSVAFHDSYGIKRWPRTAMSLETGTEATQVCYHQSILLKRVG